MKRRTRAVVALLAGGVAFAIAEAVQGRKLAQAMQHDGVTVHLTGIPIVGTANAHVGGGGGDDGGGTLIVLSQNAQAIQKRMTKVAVVAAAATVVGVALVTWGE